MHIFRIPGQFRPSNSVLGLLILRLVKDRLRAESLYIVAASAFALVALLGSLVAWSLLLDSTDGLLSKTAYWNWQMGTLGFLVVFAGLGFKRGCVVTWSGQELRIRSGRSRQIIPIQNINRASRISSLEYYRSTHPYGIVTPYINRNVPWILVVETSDRMIALALNVADSQKLLTLIEASLGEETSTSLRVA